MDVAIGDEEVVLYLGVGERDRVRLAGVEIDTEYAGDGLVFGIEEEVEMKATGWAVPVVPAPCAPSQISP